MAKIHESETEGYSASQIAKGVGKVAVIGAVAVGAAYLGACGIGIAALSWLGGAVAGATGAVAAGAYVGATKGKKGFAEAANLTASEVAITAGKGAALGAGIGMLGGAVGAGVPGMAIGAVAGAAIGGGGAAAAAISPTAKAAVNNVFDKVADGAKILANVITSKEFFKSVALGSTVGITLGVLAILAAPATFGGSIAAAVLVLSIGAIAGGYIGGKINQRNAGKPLFPAVTHPHGKEHGEGRASVHAHEQAQGHARPEGRSETGPGHNPAVRGRTQPIHIETKAGGSPRKGSQVAAITRRRAAQERIKGNYRDD